MQLTQKKKLYISIGSSLFALLLVYTFLGAKKRDLTLWSDPQTVVTASKDILEGVVADESMVEEVQIPKKFIQPGAFVKVEAISGLVTIAPVKKGEQVTDTKLVPASYETGLSAKIPIGKRAVSLPVDDVSGVSNLVKSNNFVDVLATFDFGNETESKVYTYTILEGVQVLAVGDEIGNREDRSQKKDSKGIFSGGALSAINESMKRKTVTLALSPSDVQKLVLAEENGKVFLSLRPKWEDEKALNLEPATPASVTGMNELLNTKARNRFKEYRGR